MSNEKNGAKEEIRFNVRLPPELHQRVITRAKANGRSMNSEIIEMLTLVAGDIENKKLDELREKLVMLDARMRYTAAELDEIAQQKNNLLTEITLRERMMGHGRPD
ncbi:Arc family DNA-binding protein [Sphingobium fuliginis]|uniref:Arc family DNA-binding protein n=1 Tax=Sphingobium fuliginis (strain ATCC 27551) TaxID=336203 RepID=UPI0037C6E11E